MSSSLSKLVLVGALFLILINIAFSYEILNTPTCQNNNKQQSPIDVDPFNTFYREEKYFHLVLSNYTAFNSSWTNVVEERAIGFVNSNNADWGFVQFIKDWSIYKFNLKKVLFRYRSGHTIDGRRYDVEMELFHEIDNTFRTSGRYIKPSSDHLVISVFFMADSENSDLMKSNFFNYTNLERYTEQTTSDSAFFTRLLKLNQLVQNSGSYFYEGANTYGDCSNVWRLLLPKYQLIHQSQFANLRTIVSKLGYIDVNVPSSSNSRNQQQVNQDTRVYRNIPQNERILIEQSYHQYVKAQGIKLSIYAFFASLLIMLFA